MTKDETRKILNTLDGSYKNFTMGRDKQIVFAAWYEVLKAQDFSTVYAKVIEWVTTKNAPPAISDLVSSDWRKKYERASQYTS